MTALQILMLVGFTTGAVLHLYIIRLIARRGDLWGPEPAFIRLGATLGIWHLGNLLAALFRILGLVADDSGGGYLVRGADTLAFTALAALPATLAHAHIRFWGWRDDYRRVSQRIVLFVAAFGYAPLLLLPFLLALLWQEPYDDPIGQLGWWLVPFSIWHVCVLVECACLDLHLKRYFVDPRERSFFDRLSVTLFVTAVFFVVVFPLGLRHMPNIGPWLVVLVQLFSIVPTTIVGWYIFRYNLYKLVIQRSLVYASLAVLALVVYLYGVRVFDRYLVDAYGLKAGIVEAIGVVTMVLVAWPARRAIDASLRQLLETEIGHYRTLVEQVSTESHNFNELKALLPFIESIVTRALEVDGVRIVLEAPQYPDTPESKAVVAVRNEMIRDRLDVLQDDPKVWAAGARVAVGLWHDEELIGLMLIVAEKAGLSTKKQAVLSVLAGQIAVAIENCRLVEEKIRLERELMQRERLAVLGQMAATVAHEVKNPLSAIKSIVQVMCEENGEGPHGRDLSLIVGEVDRLSQTVTQLLSFSRPAVAESRALALADLMTSVAWVVEPDAQAAGVEFSGIVENSRDLPGTVAAALQEVALNLTQNAIQATPPGGRVELRLDGAGDSVRLWVTDSGSGIPADLRVKIFQPFFTTRQRGTGLGLAIVDRRIAELNGSLDIESPLEGAGGTRVCAIVPLAKCSPAPS
jgi:signal transduction histidine kinase